MAQTTCFDYFCVITGLVPFLRHDEYGTSIDASASGSLEFLYLFFLFLCLGVAWIHLSDRIVLFILFCFLFFSFFSFRLFSVLCFMYQQTNGGWDTASAIIITTVTKMIAMFMLWCMYFWHWLTFFLFKETCRNPYSVDNNNLSSISWAASQSSYLHTLLCTHSTRVHT